MMARTLVILVLLCVVSLGAGLHEPQPEAPALHGVQNADLRFEAVDVWIDSGDIPLAAYQVEIRAAGGRASIVGIEGGDHAALADPPHYDPRALHEGQINERIVIAAFSTDDALPRGRTRVARLHLAVQGETKYQITLQAAGNRDGLRIEASADLSPTDEAIDQPGER
jgi:hypothetical protein